jgi:hypothetical protein
VKIESSATKYITNIDGTITLPYEEGLLEWLQQQYPYSKYRIVELHNEMVS